MPSTNNNKRGRESETEEQRLSRLAKQRTRTDNNRANETLVETQQRRQRNEEHMQQRRQRDREHHDLERVARSDDMAVEEQRL